MSELRNSAFFALPINLHHSPVLLAAFIMLGLTIGAEGDLVNYLVRSYFGLRAFGTLYGIGFAGYAFGGVVGPVLIGKLFDAHKNYELVLSVFPWMLIAAAAALLTLGKYRAGSQRRHSQHLAAAE
jgi:MFS family permease